jgi:transcription antitermination factor NusG
MSMFHDAQVDKKWHVIYVKARHEKRFHSEMLEMGLESFLPMRRELHAWSDRKKWVEVPLFSSYVFVRMFHSVQTPSEDLFGTGTTSGERKRVYSLSGFVRFVSSNGKPSIVPEWQIDGIRKFVEFYPEEVDVLDSDYVGTEGIIIGGPLMGMHGKVVDVKNQKCFTMKVDGIDKVVSVTIPVSLFKPSQQAGSPKRETYRQRLPKDITIRK